MTWQVTEGVRVLLEEWGVQFSMVRLLLDNAAAISIAENGSTWRTRYFGVRGSRITEEVQKERLLLGHQPTKAMVADGRGIWYNGKPLAMEDFVEYVQVNRNTPEAIHMLKDGDGQELVKEALEELHKHIIEAFFLSKR